MLQKKFKGKKNIKLQKKRKKRKRKSETAYCMRREKIEAWSKDDAFKSWDTGDWKPVKDKT